MPTGYINQIPYSTSQAKNQVPASYLQWLSAYLRIVVISVLLATSIHTTKAQSPATVIPQQKKDPLRFLHTSSNAVIDAQDLYKAIQELSEYEIPQLYMQVAQQDPRVHNMLAPAVYELAETINILDKEDLSPHDICLLTLYQYFIAEDIASVLGAFIAWSNPKLLAEKIHIHQQFMNTFSITDNFWRDFYSSSLSGEYLSHVDITEYIQRYLESSYHAERRQANTVIIRLFPGYESSLQSLREQLLSLHHIPKSIYAWSLKKIANLLLEMSELIIKNNSIQKSLIRPISVHDFFSDIWLLLPTSIDKSRINIIAHNYQEATPKQTVASDILREVRDFKLTLPIKKDNQNHIITLNVFYENDIYRVHGSMDKKHISIFEGTVPLSEFLSQFYSTLGAKEDEVYTVPQGIVEMIEELVANPWSLDFKCYPAEYIQTIFDILTKRYRTNIPESLLANFNINAVKHINISGSYLSYLPQGIEKFTGLEVLNVSWNRLAELQWIKWLLQLKELIADDNHFSRQHRPAYMPSQLTRVILNSNAISGIEWIQWLQSLSTLVLTGNRISEIPAGMSQTISMLHLWSNMLQVIPDSLNFPNLEDIDISNNRLFRVPARLNNCPLLTTINISRNPITSLIHLDWIESYTWERTCYARDTYISPGEIFKLPPGWTLDIWETKSKSSENYAKNASHNASVLLSLQTLYEMQSVPSLQTHLLYANNPAFHILAYAEPASISDNTEYALWNNVRLVNTPDKPKLLENITPALPAYYRSNSYYISPAWEMKHIWESGTPSYTIIDPQNTDNKQNSEEKQVYTATFYPWTWWYIPLPAWAKIIDSWGLAVSRNQSTGIYKTTLGSNLPEQVQLSFVIDDEKTPPAGYEQEFMESDSILAEVILDIDKNQSTQDEVWAIVERIQDNSYYGMDSHMDSLLTPYKWNVHEYIRQFYVHSMSAYDSTLMGICNQYAPLTALLFQKYGIPARISTGIYGSNSLNWKSAHARVEYRDKEKFRRFPADATAYRTPPRVIAPEMYRIAYELQQKVSMDREDSMRTISKDARYIDGLRERFEEMPSEIRERIDFGSYVLDLSKTAITQQQLETILEIYVYMDIHKTLESLYLDETALEALPINLYQFQALEMIDISWTNISASIIDVFLLSSLPDLATVVIDWNAARYDTDTFIPETLKNKFSKTVLVRPE